MSYSDKLKKELNDNQEHNAAKNSTDWFKFKEGANTFRVLTEPVMMFEKFGQGICYTDCGYQGSPKLLTWILDRADGKIKLAKIPFSKGEELLNLENDADYGFTGFPMPYDITISAENAGTKEVKYWAPLPRPVKALPDEILADLKMVKPCTGIIEKMKANQKQKHIEDGTFQKEQDRKAALAQELASKRVVGGGKPIDSIDYPTDNISPDDIPF